MKRQVLASMTGALAGALCFATPGVASAQPATPDQVMLVFHPYLPLVPMTSEAEERGSPPRATAVWVRPGDTLSQIATEHGTTWEALAGWNRLSDPNLIMPGQRVILPPPGYRAPAAATWAAVMAPKPAPAPRPVPAVVQSTVVATPVAARANPAATPRQVSPADQTVRQPSGGGGGWSGPWACIAQHESGGNPATDTGNGYFGGLQFTMQTWQAYGGSGNPANASISEQEAVANRVVAASGGYGAWPNTSRMCGY